MSDSRISEILLTTATAVAGALSAYDLVRDKPSPIKVAVVLGGAAISGLATHLVLEEVRDSGRAEGKREAENSLAAVVVDLRERPNQGTTMAR